MRRILLPEGDDDRIRQAALVIAERCKITPILIGSGESSAGVSILPPSRLQHEHKYADELRRVYLPKVELTDAQVKDYLADPIHLAAVMLACGEVDGVVAGACHSTAHVVRTALRVVKCRPGVGTVSGFFLMRPPNRQAMLFADCALVAEPTEEQLVDIAIATAISAQSLLQTPPVVAMLSFSTAASADHPAAQKIARATAKLQAHHPGIVFVGEIQVDAALDVEVAKRKGINLPQPANVFIFPDLNAGNIGYKLVQRFTGCRAVGPILQGLCKPFNDLSRGASVEDIVEMVELTAQQ